MRGKVTINATSGKYLGITPAYAGKRPWMRDGPLWSRDHPRVCGEKPTHLSASSRFQGSPPRMRGKDLKRRTSDGQTGITTAYAGKRRHGQIPRASARDHPRVCGEKYCCWLVMLYALGSPPRMRGKVYAGFAHGTGRGITPAYAGKSASIHAAAQRYGDHPRVCGEKALKALKYKRRFFWTLKFPLTSDRSLM